VSSSGKVLAALKEETENVRENVRKRRGEINIQVQMETKEICRKKENVIQRKQKEKMRETEKTEKV
jgi:hypothetical protein